MTIQQRSPLVVGNWKMHGTFASNSSLNMGIIQVQQGVIVNVDIAPPSLYLSATRQQLTGSTIALAAQNVASEDPKRGLYGGNLPATMLADVGVTYGIVGHSERRQYYGETDALVAQKCLRLQEQGIQPIICVGESLVEREAGQVEQVVSRQLRVVMERCRIKHYHKRSVYKPVWAIGTGKTATPQDAQAVHQFLGN